MEETGAVKDVFFMALVFLLALLWACSLFVKLWFQSWREYWKWQAERKEGSTVKENNPGGMIPLSGNKRKIFDSLCRQEMWIISRYRKLRSEAEDRIASAEEHLRLTDKGTEYEYNNIQKEIEERRGERDALIEEGKKALRDVEHKKKCLLDPMPINKLEVPEVV